MRIVTDHPNASPVEVVPDRNPDRPLPIPWEDYRHRVLQEWSRLLASAPEEPAIQRFLERHPSMVPGGSGDIGPGGHHGSTHMALFSEPELTGAGRDFEPDFMWITRSTSLITPILIEIEKPSKRWFRRDGRPTAAFTSAHDQLNDWRSWFARDANKLLFRERFMFGQRYDDRPLFPYYVLIYGRSEEFGPDGGHVDPSALRHKRDQQRLADESFMTFDSLVPKWNHADAVTIKMTATGAEAVAFSPMYSTDTNSGLIGQDIRGIAAALDRSVMMTDERRSYLKARFEYWTRRERLMRQNQELQIHTMGRE